jgi:hypothetical protein
MGLGVFGAGSLGDLAGVVAGVAGTLGDARGVWKVELKMSASFVKACCCASPIDANGVAGTGFNSAWVSAAVVFSGGIDRGGSRRGGLVREKFNSVCDSFGGRLGGVDAVTAVVFSGWAKIPAVASMEGPRAAS